MDFLEGRMEGRFHAVSILAPELGGIVIVMPKRNGARVTWVKRYDFFAR